MESNKDVPYAETDVKMIGELLLISQFAEVRNEYLDKLSKLRAEYGPRFSSILESIQTIRNM